jgi:ribosome-associated protein
MNSEQLSKLAMAALDDGKGLDLVKLDVRELTAVTDYMIVASGTSNRHVRALADAVAEKSREAGRRPSGIEGEDGSEWVLLDLQDVLVHVMLPRVREFYNLEKLWCLSPATEKTANSES